MTSILQRTGIHQRRHVFALSVVFVCSLPTIARAEVHVEGSPAVVRVTTSRDTISDVLSALAATFNVQYRTAIPLNAAADATYSGSFRQVISRLLDGYNYTIKTDDSKTTEIVVFGKRGEAANPPPKTPTDKPEVTSVQSKPDESSANAVGLCMSMGSLKLSREPSRKRVISRTFTCTGDLARNLKLALDKETKETLDGFGHRYAPGGARAKTIEYECPETDRCSVIVKY
jgi:hypothetical protein